MANERSPLPQTKGTPPPPRQERAGRTGEGARSVIPHMKADMRARAEAKLAKRQDRET